MLEPIKINVIISEKNNKPMIYLKSCFTDDILIKELINCALEQKTLEIIPKFSQPLRSMCSMINKGILKKDEEDGKYILNF